MIIPDKERAKRKLSQIGYYRLSGFWYPCRKGKMDANGSYITNSSTGLPIRGDDFQENTNFDEIISLYLFDKKLRQLMLDAIERIEIHIRSIIAHELGRFDPLAYRNQSFVNPKVLKDKIGKQGGSVKNYWNDWINKQIKLVDESKEECIKHHKDNNTSIPFWVIVETWDFGLMSKYYSNLNASYQNIICKRLEIDNRRVLGNWLDQINLLRNDCAHHKRIWNKPMKNAISVIDNEYFSKLNLDENARKKIYGMICVLWFLVKKIGPNSTWIKNVANLIDSKPRIDSCPYTAMGFTDNTGFPKEIFSLVSKEKRCLSFYSLFKCLKLKK